MNEIDLQKTREAVAAELKKLTPRAEPEDSLEPPAAVYGGYHEAAAVLTYFDPEKLRPTREGADEIEDLLVDSGLDYDDRGRSKWTILPDVRRAVLKQLGTREAMLAALAANPERPDDPTQRHLETFLRGETPDLESLSLEELVCTYQVLDWLPEGALAGLPEKQEVARRLEQLRLLQPFHKLVGGHFRGREAELQTLNNYVGVLPPGSKYESIKRDVKKFLSLHERPPLLIYAPGGMGKSTLVAKFILDHTSLGPEDRFPFVYIDFDRPSLVAEEPLTLLMEAVRQLGAQYPEGRESCEKIADSWHGQLTAALRRSRLSDASHGEKASRPATFRDRTRFLEDFSALLKTLGVWERPLLLVLDTFEEVQYRSHSFIMELWRFLDQLQQAVPRLRTVISGRSKVNDFQTEELELPLLDPAASQGFLEDRGVNPPETAAAIARQVGGDPLSLNLAANVFRLEGANAEGIRDLRTREFRFGFIPRRIEQGRIQGQLYERILKHIHTDEVKALAHPGLILRRITPDIIHKVLAAPCGIKVKDLADAERLFAELRREVSLVVPADDGSLRHRPDVRRLMVGRLMASDEKEKVEEIQHAAVAYYERQEGAVARAEEIYHRLALKEEHAAVEARWMEGVQPHLYNAVEELAPAEQAYLASRLGVDLNEQIWKEADLDDWERRTAGNVEKLLQVGDVSRALAALEERSERTLASPLFLLESRVYTLLNQWEEVSRVVERGVKSVAQTGEVDMLFNLLTRGAEADTILGNTVLAHSRLAEAAAIARGRGNKAGVLIVNLLLTRLGDDPEAPRKVSEEVAATLVSMTDAELSEQPALLRDVAAVWGGEDAALLARAVRLVGIETATASQRRALARAVVAWETELARETQSEPGVVARTMQLRQMEDLAETWSVFLQTAPERLIGVTLAQVLEQYKVSEDVRKVLLDIMRAPAPQADAPQGGAYEVSSGGHDSERAPAVGLDLNASQLDELRVALSDAFPGPESLAMVVKHRLERNLDAISLSSSLESKVNDLIEKARSEGWLANLIVAARESNPTNPRLLASAQQFGLAFAAPEREVLEKVVDTSGDIFDLEQWSARFGRLEGTVCRVEAGNSGPASWRSRHGTAFLVGPDLLLTSYRLVEEFIARRRDPQKVAFRFDFRRTADGIVVNPGRTFTLHPSDWLVDYSSYGGAEEASTRPSSAPFLNYALLRLALAVGSEPIGGDRAEPNAPPRGWVNIPPEPISLTPGSPLLIMEYPAGQLIKVAFNSEGVIALSPDGVRLTHRVNTRAGATGSPCFDANLNLVAIHHQQEEGSAGNPGHGEATLIEAIVRLLRERGKGGLQARAAGGFVGLDAEGNMKPPAGSPSGESGS